MIRSQKTRALSSIRHWTMPLTQSSKLGPGCMMSKSDIQHSYKIIPVHTSEVHKLGIFCDPGYWCDLTLTMRCRTSAKIVETFTTALEWIFKNKFHLHHTHHILNDFLLITQPAALAQSQLSIFLSACKYLDITIVK